MRHLYVFAVGFSLTFLGDIARSEQPAAIPQIPYDYFENWDIGGRFSNHLIQANQDRAHAKLKKLRELNRDVSMQEFLGGKIRRIRIEFFDNKQFTNFESARDAIASIIASAILSSKRKYEEPSLYAPWAERTRASVRALVFYDDGFIGRIEVDGTHFFFQDDDGMYWWYRK